MMGGTNFGCCGTFGWGGGILGLLINLAIIVLTILVVIWLVRKFVARTGNGLVSASSFGQVIDARDVLQIRYAKGEITREQYQKMLEDLSQ